MKKLVTLKTCANPFEAQIIKARLEDGGIPAMVTNEMMGTLYAGAVEALNPRVLVDDCNLEQAKAILDGDE